MSANKVLNEIVHSIRDSKLNFTMNLTPFSAYITIRSSFVKNYIPTFVQQTQHNCDQVKAKEMENEIKILSLKVKSLEEENVALKTGFENFEIAKKTSETEASAVKEEKRLLQIKHEKICAEFKLVKNEKEDLTRKSNALSVTDKTNKKEIFELKKHLDKKSNEFEIQLRDLKAFQEQKMAEERAIKQQEKKNKKKAKRELHNEAKVKAEQLKSARTPTILDANANAPPPTVKKQESGAVACDLKEDSEIVDLVDVETKQDIIEEAIELEKVGQKMGSFEKMFENGMPEVDERNDIRNLTKKVFDDLMKNLSTATDVN